jgi:hypothetical protein
LFRVKAKGKVHPGTGHEFQEVEERYDFAFSLTLTPDGVDGQRHALAYLPRETDTVPVAQEDGCAPGPV